MPDSGKQDRMIHILVITVITINLTNEIHLRNHRANFIFEVYRSRLSCISQKCQTNYFDYRAVCFAKTAINMYTLDNNVDPTSQNEPEK
jgi:hypothetical protein